jgi:hypothetical protein
MEVIADVSTPRKPTTYVKCVCLECRKPFMARRSAIARGWAKCCSKSCAAYYRERGLDRKGSRFHNGQKARKLVQIEEAYVTCHV